MLFYFHLKALKRYSYIFFPICYFTIGDSRVAKHQTYYVKVIVEYYILVEYYLCVIYSQYLIKNLCAFSPKR